jgi:DMSO/TMAO reductase YedYZ molybdopterin-dependent catalytic subunit
MSENRDDEAKRRKLVGTKERWARQGRALTGLPETREAGRLPPGQHVVKNWPVLDLGVQPEIALERWRLRVFGAVESPVIWDWAGFLAQPQTREVSDIHCVTTWSRYDNRWQGVSARHLLATVRPKPEARFVVLHSYDGYTTNLPLACFADDDVLLAHSWDGAPIPREHGGPVRAVVPKLYFWKSAKWLRRVELVAEDRSGFWEERGYHDRGDPRAEERYSE